MKHIYILLLILPYAVQSQFSIEPHVVYYGTNLNTANESTQVFTSFENDFAYAIGLGVDFRHKLKSNLFLNYGLTSSFVTHNSKHFNFINYTGALIDIGIEKTALSRWDYHAGLGFFVTKFLFLQFNAHYVVQPYQTNTTFSERSGLGVEEYGVSGKAAFYYKKISAAFYYQYGINNLVDNFNLYKPFRSLGIELTYQFDINKNKRKAKR